MNRQPFFTIGIPAYKVEDYLAKCLDSVLTQSFADFEIVAVDDGSPDRSIDILNAYAEKDRRIKVIRKPNCGVAAARNTVIYNASGMYIYFLDSDDTMCEDALENAHKCIVLEDYPDFILTGYKKILNDKVIECSQEKPDEKYFAPHITKDDRVIMMWADKNFRDQVYTRFISREFLLKCGISFISSYFAQEDNEFVFNLHRKADRIGYGNFFACNYNKSRENSISTEWSCRAVASVFNRWHSFFYADYRYYNLTEDGMRAFEKGKADFLQQIRFAIIGLPLYRSDAEIETLVSLLENYFEKDIRRLPVGKTSHAPVYLMYKLIGIRKTMVLLKIVTKILRKK